MSYEDMGSSSDKKFSNKLLRNETSVQGPVAVIESKLISGDSSYSKVITWISTTNYLVNHIEYYDRKGALLKTTDMSDYKQFSGNVWRAQNILVKMYRKSSQYASSIERSVDQSRARRCRIHRDRNGRRIRLL